MITSPVPGYFVLFMFFMKAVALFLKHSIAAPAKVQLFLDSSRKGPVAVLGVALSIRRKQKPFLNCRSALSSDRTDRWASLWSRGLFSRAVEKD